MKRHRIASSAMLALVIAAVAAPTAGAKTDFRSADAIESARIVEARQSQSQGRDLRSPDSRDAAEGRGTFSAPEVTVVRIDESSPNSSSGGGLDWGDVGIGAGGLLGLLALGSGGVLAITHRRHRGTRPPTATTA